MERLSRRDLEQILGIYAPFAIKDIALDLENETLEVQVEEQLSKRGLFGTSKPKSRYKSVRWNHVKTGRFSTIIQLEATPNTFSKSRTLNPPAFMGPESANYTYQLQQTVMLAASKALSSDAIHAITGIERGLVNQIITDSQTEEQESQVNSQLPLETDPIWRAIIKHEVSFKTSLPSLRFLISKLELSCFNAKDDPSVMQEAVATLRQFFIKNRSQLKSEYAQIGVNQTPEKPAENNDNKKNKRVTLTVDHPIWNSILSGEVDLLSKNTGLNLYITQLKSLYRKPEATVQDKFQIAKELLSYLKKNMAKLKPELMAISKMVNQLNEQASDGSLPDETHQIWQQVLEGKVNIESQQMALKLLLVKARATDDKLEAGRIISQYFARNTRVLSAEIEQLEQHIAVAS